MHFMVHHHNQPQLNKVLMRTLLCFPNPPLLFPKPASAWNPGGTFIHPKNLQNPATWKLHANSKGFGASTPSSRIEEIGSSKSNNNKDEEEGHLPQVVLERIIVRMLIFVGVPLTIGIASLHFFGMVKEKQLFDVPLWLPLLTTFITFGMSAVGIAYGPLSTSWDTEKKGSLLGFEEAKQNWVEVWTEDDS